VTFADDIKAFTAKLKARNQAVFVNTASAVKGSITDGSSVTASPGQPVDTGTLKASWHLTFESPTSALISTNVKYAPVIEDNVRGATLRSAVGGFHSVRYTIGGFERLVAVEVRRAGGSA
jgi:hypothetical protein